MEYTKRKKATRSSASRKSAETKPRQRRAEKNEKSEGSRRKRTKKQETQEEHDHQQPNNSENGQEKTVQPTEKQIIDGIFGPPAEVGVADSIKEDTAGLESIQKDQQNLPLPQKYIMLEHIFNSLVTVFYYLKARKQSCTWSNIKSPIESLCGRTLQTSQLAQLKTVLPDVLNFEMRKIQTRRGQEEELTVTINPGVEEVAGVGGATNLRHQFHQRLVQMVQAHHDTFLSQQRKNADHTKLTQWHPKFPLQDVPDVPCAPLPIPNPPTTSTSASSTSSSTSNTMSDDDNSDENEDGGGSVSLHGMMVPAALLARVRQAEEASKLVEDKHLHLKQRLPLIARMVHSIYTEEKRASMPITVLVDRLLARHEDPISRDEAAQLLSMLAGTVPHWLCVSNVEGLKWARISKTVSLAQALSSLA
jgi:hypothetical protein